MENVLNKALVHQILAHAEAFPWTMQGIGLLGLRLDDRREHRLHIWDPSMCVNEPPVHDHPFDFTSRIIVGEMVNTRYTQDPAGIEYSRIFYSPTNEDTRRSAEPVRLSKTATKYAQGEHYSQLAHELHDSQQLPGTVTIIRMTFKDVKELTVCRRDNAPWESGHSRLATPLEVRNFCSKALALF